MLVFAIFIFIAIIGVGMTAGLKLYVRPKEAMERVVGLADTPDAAPTHPSLAFHELIKKLGTLVPQSPKDVTVMQRRLIRAGIKSESALRILYGAKFVCGITLPLLVASFVVGSSTDSSNKFAAILAAGAAGFFGPNEYVRRLARKRQLRAFVAPQRFYEIGSPEGRAELERHLGSLAEAPVLG